VLDSPTRGSEQYDAQPFTADKRAREAEGGRAKTSKQPMHSCCGTHAHTAGCRHDGAPECATCGHGHCQHRNNGKPTSPVFISPDPETTSANVNEVEQATRYAAQVLSLTAKLDLQTAHEAIIRHMSCGNLMVAAQRACAELMDGPAKRTIFRNDQDGVELPDDAVGSLAERHFGATARTPTVREMAQKLAMRELAQSCHLPAVKETATEEQPSALFSQRLQANLQQVGGSLTAGQRLATATRTDCSKENLHSSQLRLDPLPFTEDYFVVYTGAVVVGVNPYINHARTLGLNSVATGDYSPKGTPNNTVCPSCCTLLCLFCINSFTAQALFPRG